MAAATKKPKLHLVRLAGTFITPPGLLGFANLIEPDTAFNQSKFKLNWHPTDDQARALADKLDAHVVEPLWDKFLALADELKVKAPKQGWNKPLGLDWMEEHTKDPKEGSRIELPFIVFDNASEFNNRDGVPQARIMKATDMGGNAVDLKQARVGMGSTVQVLCSASMWSGAFSKGLPAVSLKLAGLRILKLVQFGGAGKMEEVSDEDLALLGDGFEADDLSGYVGNKKASETPREEVDEEIPF